MSCDRCGRETPGWTLSFFNTERICLSCSTLESQHPDYPEARRLESEAADGGDLNFVGAGLPSGYAEWAAAQQG